MSTTTAKSLVQLKADAKAAGWAHLIKTTSDEKALVEGCYFDAKAADHVCDFFPKYLRHSKGRWGGKPFELLPWESDEILRPLFGWKRPGGRRRFNFLYAEVPKKNGKSTLAAGVGLYMLTVDGESGPEVYSVATEQAQAQIVHNEAIAMVTSSPQLSKKFKVNRSTKTIYRHATAATYKALSSQAESKEGINPHAIIADELHVWKGNELWDTLRYAMAARENPIFFAITTAGIYDPASIGWQRHAHALEILSGRREEINTLVYMSGADEGDDWTDEKVWEKANPSYGVTIRADEMRESCKEAQEVTRLENTFRRYRLNQWTEQVTRWLKMADWDACSGELPDNLPSIPCYAALDLAQTQDLAAFTLVFPNELGGYDILTHAWCPKDAASERSKKGKVDYLAWAKEGLIEMTPGPTIDYNYIRRRVNELGKQYQIIEIAYDPWNAHQLATQLGEEDGFEMIQYRQGYISMNEPAKEFERLVIKHCIRHGDNGILNWQAANVTVRMDPAGNIKPDKLKSSSKIDNIVTVIMGIGRAMLRVKPTNSVYNERGPIVLG